MGLILKVNIPKRGQKVTNGDVIKALFPNIDKNFSNVIDMKLWWNALYKINREAEDEGSGV